MKRLICAAAAALTLFVFTEPGFAVYTDAENNISIDFAQGDGVYYLTPDDNNLFNDLSEKLKIDGRDIRFYVCKYTPQNETAYSLTITANPAESILLGGIPADLAGLTAEQKTAVSSALTQKVYGGYEWAEPKAGEIGGLPALVITGEGRNNAACDIYAVYDGNKFITAEAVYTKDSEGNNLTDITKLLNSVTIGVTPEPTPSVEITTPTGTAAVEPTEPAVTPAAPETSPPAVETAPATVETAAPTEPEPGRNFFENIIYTLKNAWQNDPYFKYYIAGAAIVLAAVAAIIIGVKRKRNRYAPGVEAGGYYDEEYEEYQDGGNYDEQPVTKRQITLSDYAKDDEAADPVNNGAGDLEQTIKADPASFKNYGNAAAQGDTIRADAAAIRNTQKPKALEADAPGEYEIIKDKTTEAAGSINNNGADKEEDKMLRNADYEKDISKYTRQPGRDVNDISKNTIGRYSDADDLTIEIARASQTGALDSSRAKSWKTEGTRMGRHKKKKK